jgi:ribose 5-phosphate isomerase RpiB
MLPQGKKIDVTFVWGDQEAFTLANQIYQHLKDAGFDMETNGVSQVAYAQPVKGVHVETNKDPVQIIVGANMS